MNDPAVKESQQSLDFPNSFYRVAAKGVCIQEGKILFCHEDSVLGEAPKWELPGGGVDFGESPAKAIVREVSEEMNLIVTRVAPRPLFASTHRVEKRRGMDWWYALLLLYEIEIEDFTPFRPSEECREYHFFAPEELPALPEAADDPRLKLFAEFFTSPDFKETRLSARMG
jgi:8-oxo-dGTP diphosphatase